MASQPRFDLIDQSALRVLADVMAEGLLAHPDDGWRELSTRHHVKAAMAHLSLWWDGDQREDHLAHAFTRLMMAVAVSKKGAV